MPPAVVENQFFILLALIAAAAAVLGWRVFELEKKMKLILGGKNPESAEAALADVMRRVAELEKTAAGNAPRLALLETIAEISIQKVGFLRFNPFSDTGGDNSFVAALLDRTDTGIIISSLYTREGMRLYAKKIERGKAATPLSDEEKKALGEAMRTKN